LERAAAAAGPVPSFEGSLRGAFVSVIAEVKRRSPSKGWIKSDISAATQARSYEAGGAAAISVLTEPSHFGGANDDLTSVRAAVRLPILKKDFHVDPVSWSKRKRWARRPHCSSFERSHPTRFRGSPPPALSSDSSSCSKYEIEGNWTARSRLVPESSG